MTDNIICSGIGGQGSISVGKMICEAGMHAGKEVCFLPSYGSQMRGGTASCNVVVSDEPVDSPQIMSPNFVIALDPGSVANLTPIMKRGGTIVINSSLCSADGLREDLTVYAVPGNDIVKAANAEKSLNMVFLGAYAAISGAFGLEEINNLVDITFTGRKAVFSASNKAMAKAGYEYIKENYKKESN